MSLNMNIVFKYLLYYYIMYFNKYLMTIKQTMQGSYPMIFAFIKHGKNMQCKKQYINNKRYKYIGVFNNGT